MLFRGDNMNTCVCKHCGHSFEQPTKKAEIEFAKQFGEKELVAIWLCPKCKKDNKSTIKVAD